jgi:D-aminoacyl-tRNA deacylase
MRVVIQRTGEASVTIEGEIKASIEGGLLVLAGFTPDDSQEDMEWIAGKIVRLRLFNDKEGVMNLSINETGGEILAVSQFTLHARTRKGNRPSYIGAAPPEIAIPLWERFLQILEEFLPGRVKCGEFGAKMDVRLLNDGPVTIIIDSKTRE